MAGQVREVHAPQVPGIRFLRVESDSGVSYLALGYLEGSDGQREVWYSAQQQVLFLTGGRLSGSGGLSVDWASVRFGPVPDWGTVSESGAFYERERDVMPGYQFAVRERVRVRRWSPLLTDAGFQPPKLPSGLKPESLTWFLEQAEPEPGSRFARPAGGALPPAWFAVDLAAPGNAAVAYSVQCLAPGVCLKLRPLPMMQARPVAGRVASP